MTTVINFDANLYGIDLIQFNPRCVVSSLSQKPIFKGLSPASVDSQYQDEEKLMEMGMTVVKAAVSQGSNDVEMTYGYSAFARDWNIGPGTSATVLPKGIKLTGDIDFGHNQFKDEQSASTNVAVYIREQKSVYTVSVDPKVASLDPNFILSVNKVNSIQDAEREIVNVYGTHYPSKVFYGGDRSAYLTMSSSTYANAKVLGADIKAKFAAKMQAIQPEIISSHELMQQTKNSVKLSSGLLTFSQLDSQPDNQQMEDIFQGMSVNYQAIGGIGDFKDWSVTEDNAAAIAVNLEPLYDLLEPSIFKDGTSHDDLTQKKDFIKQAIDRHLKQLKRLDNPLSVPRVYSVTLNRLEVIAPSENNLDNATRETIQPTANSLQTVFDSLVWNLPELSNQNIRYQHDQVITPNTLKTFVQLPSQEGYIAPLQIPIGDNSKPEPLAETGLQPSTPSATLDYLDVSEEQTISFDCKAISAPHSKSNIRATITLQRHPSDFKEVAFTPYFLTIQHTKRDASTSHNDLIVNYKTWGGGNWTAKIGSDGQFSHQAQGANSGHSDIIIDYQTWGGDEWTATINPQSKVFKHIRRGTPSGHEDSVLDYTSWDGSEWTMRIV